MPAVGTTPTMLPSNGERTSSVSPERAAVHCPPINNCVLVNSVSSLVSSGRRPAPTRANQGRSFRTPAQAMPQNSRPFLDNSNMWFGRSKNCLVNEVWPPKTSHDTGLQGSFTQGIVEYFHWMNRTVCARQRWFGSRYRRRHASWRRLDKSSRIGLFQV